MTSNYFECCSCVNPSDSVPEVLSNIIIHNKKQDDDIAKKVNKDDLSEVANSGRYDDLIDKPTALPNPKPITINGQRYDGSDAVTVTVSSEGGGMPVEIDDTLTQSGKAADAKVVGDQLTALNEAIANVGNPTDEQVSSAVNAYLDEHPVTGFSEALTVVYRLFERAVFTEDVSAYMAKLYTFIASSVGIEQVGTTLIINSGVTATQSGDVLALT